MLNQPKNSMFMPGILHLSILIETMRREGYEMSIATACYYKTVDGVKHEQ